MVAITWRVVISSGISLSGWSWILDYQFLTWSGKWICQFLTWSGKLILILWIPEGTGKQLDFQVWLWLHLESAVWLSLLLWPLYVALCWTCSLIRWCVWWPDNDQWRSIIKVYKVFDSFSMFHIQYFRDLGVSTSLDLDVDTWGTQIAWKYGMDPTLALILEYFWTQTL